MLSRITIELEFETGNPYIRVINDKNSDDVKDKLVSFFKEKLGGSSNWCKVLFKDSFSSEKSIFEIHPITPQQMEEESRRMAEWNTIYEYNTRNVPVRNS